MVFQSYALYPHMTVWENISFSLRIKGIDKTNCPCSGREGRRTPSTL